MKFTKHIQGSKSWLAWRKTGITASDAAIINGTNTFGGNSPFKLWKKKHGLLPPEETTFAMEEGSRLEEEALKWFNKKYSTNFVKPPGAYDDKYEWLMASLDGYDENNPYTIEIKCGVATYKKAQEGIVPPYYYDQIQQHLKIFDKKGSYYVAYRPDQEPIVMMVDRDKEYFKKVFEKEKEFYRQLVDYEAPPLTEKDYNEVLDKEANELASQWKEIKEGLKEMEKKEKILADQLKDQTDGGNCIFPTAGVKVELRTRKGNINYSKVVKELEVDNELLEKHRKPESSWLQPVIMKQA